METFVMLPGVLLLRQWAVTFRTDTGNLLYLAATFTDP